MKYGLISDTHFHNWKQFATVDDRGVNSRLLIQLSENYRIAERMAQAGCKHLFHAGDCFHVRGSIAPSVLNPVLSTYTRIVNELGMTIHMIPGNHDLETNDSRVMTNASTALRDIGVNVYVDEAMVDLDTDHSVLVVPWKSNVGALRSFLSQRVRLYANPDLIDVIIHAPVNGIIKGIPDHGLEVSELAQLGFRRVFAGHYHNHKVFPAGAHGGAVCSVGALTHQTWGDIGSIAGGVIAESDGQILHIPTSAPLFIDVNSGWQSEEEAKQEVKGNYVRVKLPIEEESEVEEMREFLTQLGALAVAVHPVRKPKNNARKSTVNTSVTLRQSVDEYIQQQDNYGDKQRLSVLCAEIMEAADAVQ